MLLQYAMKIVDEIKEEEKMKQLLSKAADPNKEDAKSDYDSEDSTEPE